MGHYLEKKTWQVLDVLSRFQGAGCGIHGGETYFTYSILAVEVLAAIHALKLALELGHLSIILEGDSKIAIDAFWSKQQSLTKCGHLIEKAKWLVNQFEAVKFNYVPRKCKIAAHNIARYARHVSKCAVWMKDVSPHLSIVIQVDSTTA